MPKTALRSSTKEIIRRTLNRLGLEVHHRSGNDHQFHIQLLRRLQIETLIDVGASAGQFALVAREIWRFGGAIVSFEPLPQSYRILESRASKDRNWVTHQCAIANSHGVAQFNISSNLVSSSLLDMTQVHVHADKSSSYQRSEPVNVRTLDEFRGEMVGPIMLKLDVQGSELSVLQGAEATLEKVDAIHCEVSFVPLYVDGADYRDILDWLSDHGYRLEWITPTLLDPDTRAVLQADITASRSVSES